MIDFLTTYDGSAPFYLQIGYVNPHDVCEYLHNHEEKRVPNPLQQGLITEEELPPLPENFHYDESETVLQQVCRRTDDALIHPAILRGVRDWDEFHWRYLIWNYYRFIEKVDAEIGIVLSALQQTPFCDNTVIVFSADHGEACGSHQMFQKFTLYEESIRVPFIVACLGNGVPVQKNRFDREHFISGVDLVPTVYDYAGIDAPEAVQVNRSEVPRLGGMSVRPLAEGDEIPWREFAYVESNYWGRAIVTDRYKYVTEYKPSATEDFRPPGPDASRLGRAQLFDLQADPWETRNLASQPGYEDVIDSCRANLFDHEAKLNRWQIEHPNPRRTISSWGARLRAHWESLSAS